MRTLIEILTGFISYDSSWAIYAQKIDGEFREESPARFGQRQFDNGGLLDDCEFFSANDIAVDAIEQWCDGTRANPLIYEVNNAGQ